MAAIQGQVQAHADGPSDQLLTEIGDTAELLWTLAETFAGMGEFNKRGAKRALMRLCSSGILVCDSGL